MTARRPLEVVRIRALRALVAGIVAAAAIPAASRSIEEVVEVPFTFLRGTIVVPVFVGLAGPLPMMLDTGVDPSIVEIRTARRLGFAIAGKGAAGSGGGSEVNLAYETKFPSIDVGGVSARAVDALAADLSKTSAALGTPLDDVLGHSFLGGRSIEIDDPARIVRFFATRASFERALGEHRGKVVATLRFRYDDEILIDDVVVDGKKLVANLDTGSNATFQVTPVATAILGLRGEVEAMRAQESIGINGVSRNRVGSLRSVRLGRLVVDSPPAVFYGEGTGHDRESWQLRIGNGFLQRFIVAIDESRGRITLSEP